MAYAVALELHRWTTWNAMGPARRWVIIEVGALAEVFDAGEAGQARALLSQ